MRAAAKRPTNGDYQLAARTGKRAPSDRWSIDEIRLRRAQLHPLFTNADSWDQFHRLLEAQGLTLMAKGQGLVIADGTGYMKLSDLGKEIRLKGLEETFTEGFDAYASRAAAESAHEPRRQEASAQSPNVTIKVPGYGPNATSEETADAGCSLGPFPKARMPRPRPPK